MTDAAESDGRGRAAVKSASAFRTISEVSTELDVPQHVLRFWETKFPQIKPLKRGGGRRYYRPDDVELLRRIRSLLYSEGYTIKGVQRLLKESRGAVLAAGAPDEVAADTPRPEAAPPPPSPGLFDDAQDTPPDDVEDEPGDDWPAEPEPGPPGGLPGDKRRALEAVLQDLLAARALLRD